MGSDMLIAIARAPHFDRNATELKRTVDQEERKLAEKDLTNIPKELKERGTRRLRSIYARRLDAAVASMDADQVSSLGAGWLDWFDDEVTWSEELQRVSIRQEAMISLEAVVFKTDREVALVNLEGAYFLMTGGMSSGDAPTDAYNHVGLLDALGILDAPINQWEFDDAMKAEKELRNVTA